jgi:hypothetical protein
MSQAPVTVNQLILYSLYQIGELADGEVPSGFMQQTGVFLLNQLLDQFSNSEIYVPYETDINFNMVAGKDTYTVSNLITLPDVFQNRLVSLDYANYSFDTIVYPMQIINKSQYYNLTRLNTIQARPSIIFLNKQVTESILTVYPFPDQTYPTTVRGKVMIDKLDYNTNVEQVAPYYLGFLVMALTRRFKSYFPSGNWTEQDEQEYQRMFTDLQAANELDLTIRTTTILTKDRDTYFWQNILAY